MQCFLADGGDAFTDAQLEKKGPNRPSSGQQLCDDTVLELH